MGKILKVWDDGILRGFVCRLFSEIVFHTVRGLAGRFLPFSPLPLLMNSYLPFMTLSRGHLLWEAFLLPRLLLSVSPGPLLVKYDISYHFLLCCSSGLLSLVADPASFVREVHQVGPHNTVRSSSLPLSPRHHPDRSNVIRASALRSEAFIFFSLLETHTHTQSSHPLVHFPKCLKCLGPELETESEARCSTHVPYVGGRAPTESPVRSPRLCSGWN